MDTWLIDIIIGRFFYYRFMLIAKLIILYNLIVVSYIKGRVS